MMHIIISLIALSSLIIVHGQQSDKSTLIPFPRIGRSGSEPRFFMEAKKSGGSNTPGLIPFPRIGRSEGIHEGKRQLIPYPRVGKRAYFRVPIDPYMVEYDENIELSPDPSTDDFEGDKRSGTTSSNNNGMWFGPRLGKRKRRSVEDTEKTISTSDTLLKILHNFNWAIVPIKERRTFTPRLGRSSDEASSTRIHHRSQPYTPRLGRSKERASNNSEDDEDENRSKNDKNSRSTDETIGGVPFSPRLGRDHFNPRLGRRSSEDGEQNLN